MVFSKNRFDVAFSTFIIVRNVIKIVVSIFIIDVKTVASAVVVAAAVVTSVVFALFCGACSRRVCWVFRAVCVELAVEGVDLCEGVCESGAELGCAGGLAAEGLGVELLEGLEEERDEAGDVDAEGAGGVAVDGGGDDGLELLRDKACARGGVAAVAERAAAEAQDALERAADGRDVLLEARVRALQEAALRKDLAAHVQARELGRHVHNAHNIRWVQCIAGLLMPNTFHNWNFIKEIFCCCSHWLGLGLSLLLSLLLLQ